MILEVDMGNTRLKWRIRDRQTKLSQGFIGSEESLDFLASHIASYYGSIKAVSVVSVVGDELEQRFAAWSLACLGLHPQFARTSAICGVVRNGYREPLRLGVDRWLAINAAYKLIDDACVVISCGTAVTVDLLAADGKHLGGFIGPGLRLMSTSLTSGTRRIVLGQDAPELHLLPAANTTDAVYSAIAAMLTGLIDNGVRQLLAYNGDFECQLIFTGGDADKLLPFYPQARLVPDLVLDGLVCVVDYP